MTVIDDGPEATFGAYMRHMRESNHLTLRTVAQALGVSAAFVSEIERGNRWPPADPATASRWAEVVGADWGKVAGLALVERAGQWAPVVRDLLEIAADAYWLPRDPEDA